MCKFLINHIVNHEYYDRYMSEFDAKRIIKDVSYELIENE